MSSSSTVTYTSVYTDSEPRRVFWGADEELSDGGSPRVIVYRYDGLPMQPVAPPSPDYVPGPEHPLSPIYVPGPKHLPSPVEDPEEDPEEDHADYPTDEGDVDDEPSNNDDDDEDEDDNKEEERHLALADSSVVPVVDLVPQLGIQRHLRLMSLHLHPDHLRIRSPLLRHVSVRHERLSDLSHLCHHPWRHILLSMLPHLHYHHHHHLHYYLGHLHYLRSLHHHYHPPPSSLHLPLPVPTSLPLPSSPLPASLFIPPLVDCREDIPKAELPPRKRLCPTAPTSRYEVEESLTATPRPTGGHRSDYRFIGTIDAEIRRQRAEEVGYGIRDVWVDPTEAVEEVAPMTLERVNARVTELAAVQE
ncbi:hypothetical protein Tco_1246066 [Tanacetum coccineum]